MPKGSVLVWHGSLWHGGGANTTDRRRVGIAMNYCAGWIRQQENQQLGIPRRGRARFPPRLRELVGYGIYRGLIGHIDKQHPSKLLLGADATAGMIWDYAREATPSAPSAEHAARRRASGPFMEAAGGIEPPYGALQAPA